MTKQTALATRPVRPTVRDERGRFASGTRGGPGRMALAREREYLDIVMHECTPDRWREVVITAINDAIGTNGRKGDRFARDWLSDRLMGPLAYALAVQMQQEYDPQGDAMIVKLAAILTQLPTTSDDDV